MVTADILDKEVKYLPGVGPKRAALLEKELGIKTFRDLLYTFPFRYADKTRIYTVREITPSAAYIQLRGKIVRSSVVGERRGKRLTAILNDGTGSIEIVFFQGIKWIQDKIIVGNEYIVFGKPVLFNGRWSMAHPEISTVSEAITSRPFGSVMIGVYPGSEKLRSGGITAKTFSRLVMVLLERHLDDIRESLPETVIRENRLCPIRTALKNIHFPSDMHSLSAARYRLKFEELFYLQLSLLKQKNARMKGSRGAVFNRVGDAFNFCYRKLPFPLTNAQKTAIREMREDMRSGKQMNRLLQGDVGSGKTLVALFIALIAVGNGYQACLMVPTEVLAVQHFNSISRQCAGSGVKIALLTGNTKAAARKEIDAGLRDGSIDILIGTHALIEDNVVFKRLGLAVIDEQHRFGVAQRAKLRFKSEIMPHILVMTATPIPRTLAMTFYGDLDVSVLNELPPGRKPVTTIHATESGKDKVYRFLKSEIGKGRQVFIVYPLIKESETLDYRNLEEGYRTIVEEFPAPEYVTAVVHGKQTPENKAYDMALFAEGRANILVATSVIEVGVDVPNASVMLIESAERFGLSQLHQLRGRVGRGPEQSYCILMTGHRLSADAARRIEIMCSTNDGFELAEKDLKMRGPGDIEGTRQSGLAVELRISSLSKDSDILLHARKAAARILESDPMLASPENALLQTQLEKLRDTGKGYMDYSKIS